jgi:hypothetical protein
MTPCFDETAKKHSGEETMSTCMGLLHFVDGAGRWLGQIFAAGVYGVMLGSAYFGWYWPIVVASFLLVSGILHIGCHYLGRQRKPSLAPSEPISSIVAPTILAPVLSISETEP